MMIRAKRFLAAAMAAAFITVPVAARAAEPIRLGFTAALTGGTSPLGISQRDGMKIAIGEINSKGGVLGRPLQLIERDDESKNERGVQIAQELVFKEKVDAVLGFTSTGVALAAQRFYQESKIPTITVTATATAITDQFPTSDNYIFRTAPTDALQAEMIVSQAIDKMKLAKVAILADSTNYGQLGRADLEKALDKRGVKAVANEKFNIKDVDMTAQLMRAKDSGAMVILTYGVGPELAQIANGMVKLDWKVPMIGSWTLSMSNFIDNAGANGEGAMMPQTFIQSPDTPKRKAFIEAYQKAYNLQRIPSPASAAQAYDAIYILAAAIAQAGSTNGTKVRDALENLQTKVEGVITTYDKPFSKTNHEAIAPDLVSFGVVQSGRVVAAK